MVLDITGVSTFQTAKLSWWKWMLTHTILTGTEDDSKLGHYKVTMKLACWSNGLAVLVWKCW